MGLCVEEGNTEAQEADCNNRREREKERETHTHTVERAISKEDIKKPKMFYCLIQGATYTMARNVRN